MATQTAACTTCDRTGILGEDIEEISMPYGKLNLCLKCCADKLSAVSYLCEASLGRINLSSLARLVFQQPR